MQRVIKFRVWDKERKGFLHQIDIDSDIIYADTKWYIHGGHALDDNYVMQQYTGMRDKGGTEIYEGDVIRGLMDFGPAGFHERSAIVHWDIEKGYQWNYWKLFSIKIEGNMFENPELLELI
jgi:uncharacterized phage protein (TIGR01671 family)